MRRLAYAFLVCAALAASVAGGYEIPFGPGTAAGESDLRMVPTAYGRLALKYSSMPLLEFDAKGDGTWAVRSGTATARAGEGGCIVMEHVDFLKAGPASLTFKNGTLTTFRRECDEARREADVKMLTEHPRRQPTLAQLWRVRTAEQDDAEKARWWGDDSRLRLGYFNPNAAGTLFAEFAALFAALALTLRGKWLRTAFAIAVLPAIYALFLTGSRGSFIAFLAGTSLAAACRFGHRMTRRNALLALLAVVVLAAGAIAAAGAATDGRFGANLLAVDTGNVQRLRAWAAAPEMMAAAPSGWGSEPGRAYCDWFQSTNDNHRLYYLVNSHLTWLVQHGRIFRSAYIAAWLAALLLLFAFSRMRMTQVALSTTVTFAVALWFSTVGIFPTLWILPAICTAASLAAIGWDASHSNGKTCASRIAASLVAALFIGCAAPFTLEAWGRHISAKRTIPVASDGTCIRLGHGEFRTAILRDTTVLAGDAIGCLGHELRDWLSSNPGAGAILVADDPADLPATTENLVLAGKGGVRYLKHRSDHVGDGGFCRADRTIFISPPFEPSQIPLTLTQATDVELYIGEFAARLSRGYSRSLPQVTILPGCELYIPGWPALAIAKNEENGHE